jgi:hypothetical protein
MPPLPPEPDWRISRIRLSGRWGLTVRLDGRTIIPDRLGLAVCEEGDRPFLVPSREGCQQARGPPLQVNPAPHVAQGCSGWLRHIGHSHRGRFLSGLPGASIFLRPFAPRALPRFRATMDALTAPRRRLFEPPGP